MNLLHFGCGSRKFNGWINVDRDVDLTKTLPWSNNYFDAALGQHVIEHFSIEQAKKLLIELKRIIKNDGILWLTCPDMYKICKSYIDNNLSILLLAKQKRIKNFTIKDYPLSQLINHYFYDHGHKNMYDFDLLSYILKNSGWTNITKCNEQDLLNWNNNIMQRNDDEHTLYIKAINK